MARPRKDPPTAPRADLSQLEPVPLPKRAQYRKACQLRPGDCVIIPIETAGRVMNLEYSGPALIAKVADAGRDGHTRVSFAKVRGDAIVPPDYLFEIVP